MIYGGIYYGQTYYGGYASEIVEEPSEEGTAADSVLLKASGLKSEISKTTGKSKLLTAN